MGPINWLAVILSAALAVVVGVVWYGRLFAGSAGSAPVDGKVAGSLGRLGGVAALQLLSAMMMGHNYARLGAATLTAKPWLYWMQSGGIAIAFIIPALWISYAQRGIGRRAALVDAGFWFLVYLLTGTVFWALR